MDKEFNRICKIGDVAWSLEECCDLFSILFDQFALAAPCKTDKAYAALAESFCRSDLQTYISGFHILFENLVATQKKLSSIASEPFDAN